METIICVECGEIVTECDECQMGFQEGEKIYCYKNGEKHFCTETCAKDNMWRNHIEESIIEGDDIT